MKQIEFSGSTGKVRIEWSFDGDYIVRIEARMMGFGGHSDGHVLKAEFEKFAKDMAALDRTRKTGARFESARAGEFELLVRPVDGVGHLGVFGKLKSRSSQNRREVQQLKFSLEFPPEQIESAARALDEIAP